MTIKAVVGALIVLLSIGPVSAQVNERTPGVRRIAPRERQTWAQIVERDRVAPPAPRGARSPQPRSPLPNPLVARIDGARAGPVPPPAPLPMPEACPSFVGSMEQRVNFTALADDGTAIPPDTMGAIGRRHAVTMLNTQVSIQDRIGQVQYSTVALGSFWPTLPGAFDPRIFYDHHTDRYITVCAGSSQSAASNWAIQVSDGADPTGGWSGLTFDADPGNTRWADYPCVGFNDKWIVITFNMLVVPGASNPGPAGTKMWVINKAEMLSPGPNVTFWEFDIGFVTGGGSTLQPAVVLDYNVDDVLIVDNSGFMDVNTGKNLLRLSRVTGPTANPAWEPLPGSPYTTPGLFEAPHRYANERRTAAQLGSTTRIEVGDSRACNAVFRSGRLWFTHTGGGFFGGVPTDETLVFWYILQPTLPNPVEKWNFIGEGTGTAVFYPSLAVNCANDLCIAYSRVHAGIYVSTAFATRRWLDPGNGVALHTLAAGAAPYVRLDPNMRNRWGDYSATVVDPVDAMSFWTIQESATATANQWTTRWSQIPHDCAGPPVAQLQPQPVSVCQGSPVSLSFATSGGAHTYQWLKNGQPIAGAQGSSFQIPSATSDDSGLYQAVAYNVCGGVTSQAVQVQVGVTILDQPDPLQRNPCTTAQFTVSAVGVGTLEYRWHRMGALQTPIPLSDDGRITGTQTPTLTISGVRYEDEAQYLCEIIDPPCFSPLNRLFTSPASLAIPGNPAWVHRTTSGPVHRSIQNTDMAYDPIRGVCVIYGGLFENYLNDTWEWDGIAWTQKFPPANPGRRSGQELVFDTVRSRIVLFGGWGGVPINSEVWEYDGNTWALVTTSPGGPPPSAGSHGETAFDSARGKMILIYENPGWPATTNQTWEFDSATATWALAFTGPGPYFFNSPIAFDPGRAVTVGQFHWPTSNPADARTWVYPGAAWNVVAAGPTPARYYPIMAYDPVRRRVAMYGCCRGQGPGQYTTETWGFDGTFWVPLLPSFHTTQLDAVIPGGMAFDTRRRAMVMVGWAYNDPYAGPFQTWEYRYLDAITFDRQPQSQPLTPGGSVQFSVVAAGAPTLVYQWRKNGAPLGDGPTPGGSVISGALTDTLNITNLGSGDAGLYTCAVSNACGQVVSSAAQLGSPCYPDCNGDGALNLADFGCFQTRFALQNPYADCNGDGNLNLADFGCFQTKFALGCP